MPSSAHPRRHAVALLWSAVALVSGCHKLFGEFTITDEEPQGPGATLCSAGTHRCVGPWLYGCVADGSAWQEQSACASSALCDSAAGRCLSCVPESHRCNGAQLEICSAGAWTHVESCTSADECNLNSDSCRPCEPGEFQCNQEVLETCSGSGTWVEAQRCTDAAACVVDDSRRSGECRTPVCNNMGAYQCNGAHLVRCTPSGSRLLEIEMCPTPELCDINAIADATAQGLLGACLDACLPGTQRCSGAQLETCDPGTGRWQPGVTCNSEAECSAAAGACQPCTPGAVECNDGVLRRCAPSGWQVLQDCGSAGLCDAAQTACLAPGCPVADQTACLPDGLYRCPSDQSNWTLITVCPDDLCNANDALCDIAVCAPGQNRCVGDTLETCSADRRGWQQANPCASGQTCDLDGCKPGGCPAGDFRCNDIYLEQCDGSGWRRVERCATHDLCSELDGMCNAPLCAIGDFDCLGQSLRRCSDDRQRWVEYLTCSIDLTCNAEAGACI